MHDRYFHAASFFGKDAYGVPHQIEQQPGGGIQNKGMLLHTGGQVAGSQGADGMGAAAAGTVIPGDRAE